MFRGFNCKFNMRLIAYVLSDSYLGQTEKSTAPKPLQGDIWPEMALTYNPIFFLFK